ncbi:MAG: hypothetical protein KGQ57_00015 [Burkholderiales bacterium]|nr:hypothetical protein [Burkholderiales bacterium]
MARLLTRATLWTMADDLRRNGYVGRTVGIKVRHQDFQTVTRDLTLPTPTADAVAIRRAATECRKRIVLDRRIRLLGVCITGLEPAGAVTGTALLVQAELPFGDDR